MKHHRHDTAHHRARVRPPRPLSKRPGRVPENTRDLTQAEISTIRLDGPALVGNILHIALLGILPQGERSPGASK